MLAKYLLRADLSEIQVKEIHFFPDGGLRAVVDFKDNKFSFDEIIVEVPLVQ